MRDGARTGITRQHRETAVALFFCNDDAISIHVLASSASQILYDVRKHKGATSIRDIWQDYIAEKYNRKWIEKAKEAYKYFKRARVILLLSLNLGRMSGCLLLFVSTI